MNAILTYWVMPRPASLSFQSSVRLIIQSLAAIILSTVKWRHTWIRSSAGKIYVDLSLTVARTRSEASSWRRTSTRSSTRLASIWPSFTAMSPLSRNIRMRTRIQILSTRWRLSPFWTARRSRWITICRIRRADLCRYWISSAQYSLLSASEVKALEGGSRVRGRRMKMIAKAIILAGTKSYHSNLLLKLNPPALTLCWRTKMAKKAINSLLMRWMVKEDRRMEWKRGKRLFKTQLVSSQIERSKPMGTKPVTKR